MMPDQLAALLAQIQAGDRLTSEIASAGFILSLVGLGLMADAGLVDRSRAIERLQQNLDGVPPERRNGPAASLLSLAIAALQPDAPPPSATTILRVIEGGRQDEARPPQTEGAIER